jgi:hypothetical protein
VTVAVEPIEQVYADPAQGASYAFAWDWQGGDDLEVRLFRADGAADLALSYGAGWTATPAGRASGGAVTLLASPAGYDRLLVRRRTPAEQTFEAPGPTAAGFEAALDRLAMTVQERVGEFDRALQLPAGLSGLRLPPWSPGLRLGWAADAPQLALFAPVADVALDPLTGAVLLDGSRIVPAGEAETVRLADAVEIDFRHWARKFGGGSNNPALATGNSDALDAALAYWRADVTRGVMVIRFPRGRWHFARAHDLGAPYSYGWLTLAGAGSSETTLETSLSGAGTVFLRNGPTGTARTNRVSIRGVEIVTRNPAGTVSPVLLRLEDWAERDMVDVRFSTGALDQTPNTLLQLSGVWNCDIRDCHAFGGGTYKPQRALTETVRFSLTAGDATVTASEAVFSGADVGRRYGFGEPTFETVGTIASVTSATEVELTAPSPVTLAAVRGWVEPVRAATTSGSATVTLSHAAALAEDIGRWIVIRGAGTNTGVESAHYAQIAAVDSPTSMQVSPAPPRTVAGATIYWSPAVLIHETGSGFDRTNDIVIDNLRIEHYRGLGLAVQDAIQLKIGKIKLHGLEGLYDPRPIAVSQAGALIKSRTSTIADIVTEGAGFDDGRLIYTGSRSAVVHSGQGRCDAGQAAVYVEHSPGAGSTISVGQWMIYNNQHDMDSAGRRAKPYVDSDGSDFNLSSAGMVVSLDNKRYRTGGPGLTVTSISTLSQEGYFLNNGQKENFFLPTGIQHSALRIGMILITSADGTGALFSYATDGGAFNVANLIAGDGTKWAASGTLGATTGGKTTFSVGPTQFCIANDSGTGRFYQCLLVA